MSTFKIKMFTRPGAARMIKIYERMGYEMVSVSEGSDTMIVVELKEKK